MKLTFYESGGYTGLVKGLEVDTSTIDKQEGEHIHSLVEQSGILRFQQLEPLTSRGADIPTYEIKVEVDNTIYKFVFDRDNLPTEFIPLLKYLHDRAEIIPL